MLGHVNFLILIFIFVLSIQFIPFFGGYSATASGQTGQSFLHGVPASVEVGEKKLQAVAASKAWLKLLHYEKDMWGRARSLIDGRGFFFSSEGHIDSLAELKASLVAMNQNIEVGKLRQHPQCAFPERFRFIREKFNIKTSTTECPKFNEFIRQFNNPQGVSLVFSSAYPNNPASMFGHTFLKVNSEAGSDLNDQGLNFAAYVPEDDNGMAFAWFGITGGYVGQWSYQPYYVKLNEYVNFESRDLWEYELNLSREETLRLLAHFWEIETNSYFDYFFFDENCSYQILAALVAIRPDWEPILNHRIYVIPGETVKGVQDVPGLVRRVHFRPSQYKKLMRRYRRLESSEKEIFFDLIDGRGVVENISSRYILDTVAAYYDYMRSEKAGLYEKVYKRKRDELLVHRATLGASTAEELKRLPDMDDQTRPDRGHDPYAISVGAGQRGPDGSSAESFGLIRIKSAYHDLLNKDVGYSRYAHIDFPWAEFQYDESAKRLQLEKLIGVAVTSLHPMSFLNRSPSFKASFGVQTARDYGCSDCRHVFGEFGGGAAVNINSDRNIFYALAHFRAEAYSRLPRGFRYGPGLDIGLLLNPVEHYKFQVGVLHQLDLDQKERAPAYTSLVINQSFYLGRNWELRNTNEWLVSERLDESWRHGEFKFFLTRFFR